MKPVFFILLLELLLVANRSTAQSLELDNCQTLARQNYPQLKQLDLLARSLEFSVDNVSKGYYPQLAVFGQASYQSAVTALPIQLPGVQVPSLAKEQFKLFAELNQTIYDGGVMQQKKLGLEAANAVEVQKTEADLYQLRDRVNQIFFGILLLDAQKTQFGILQKDIASAIEKMQAAFNNGTALKSSVDVLKAEDLKIQQRLTEIQYARLSFLNMLGNYIGKTLNEETALLEPAAVKPLMDIRRPELQIFDRQIAMLNIQNSALMAINRPKLSFFAQAGLGRPALNMLSNEIQGYYIGGLRLNIPLSGYYTIKNDRSLISNYRQSVEIQRETFLYNTNIHLSQNNAEIQKCYELLKTDDEIIALRSSIKETALSQLNNGVITASDYLREVNAEDAAVQNKISHRIQLLMAVYKQQFISGN